MTLSKVSFLLLIVIGGGNLTLDAQIHTNYAVIKVNGKVISKTLNRQIRSGDIVKPADQLVFSSKDSYIHVINAEGTKTIRNVPDNSPRDLMQLMQSFLSPGRKNMSTRAMEKSSYEKIKSVLKEDTLLILGNGHVFIDTSDFSLRTPAGVKAKYSFLGGNASLLISDETGYYLGKEHLFNEYPGIKNYPFVTIIYYEDMGDPIHKESILLGAFTPHYANEVELEKEIKIIVKSLKESQRSNDLIVKEVAGYLMTEYATPIPENVKTWLDEKRLLDY
jgi:hypothetical protein